jgi:hypothetical protein
MSALPMKWKLVTVAPRQAREREAQVQRIERRRR